MRRREMTSHSMGAAMPSRPIGLYVGGGVLVAAIAAGLFYLSGGPERQGPSVEELSQQLSASQQELMLTSLERRDYSAALSQADTIIANDPQNAEALRVQSEARRALDEIDAAVTQARAALERGATEEAADALGRVLALDPAHPLGAELNDQLNQHFQSQAEGARAEMGTARNAAAASTRTRRRNISPPATSSTNPRPRTARPKAKGAAKRSARRYRRPMLGPASSELRMNGRAYAISRRCGCRFPAFVSKSDVGGSVGQSSRALGRSRRGGESLRDGHVVSPGGAARLRRSSVAPRGRGAATGAHERALYELGADPSSRRDCYPSNARDV